MDARGPECLLGRPFDRANLDAFLSHPDEEPDLDQFAGMQTRVYPRNGIDVHVSGRGRVMTVFLYGKRFEGHLKYRKAFPAGLPSFRISKADTIELFGRPTESGRKQETMPASIRYDLPKYVIHLEFASDASRIDRITLMTHAAGAGEM